MAECETVVYFKVRDDGNYYLTESNFQGKISWHIKLYVDTNGESVCEQDNEYSKYSQATAEWNKV